MRPTGLGRGVDSRRPAFCQRRRKLDARGAGQVLERGAAGASRAARFAANYLRLPGQAQSGVDSPRCRSTSSAGANGAAVARAIGSDPAPGGRRAGEGRWAAAASVPRPCGRSIGRASGPHPTETWPSRICTGHVSYCVHGMEGRSILITKILTVIVIIGTAAPNHIIRLIDGGVRPAPAPPRRHHRPGVQPRRWAGWPVEPEGAGHRRRSRATPHASSSPLYVRQTAVRDPHRVPGRSASSSARWKQLSRGGGAPRRPSQVTWIDVLSPERRRPAA
jgi:hypothetical protein